ncbi:MAG: hypothetical protein ACOZNI_27560 [Myxococcota bacterium]
MLLSLLLLSCDPAEKARDLCRARRETLDELYAAYGGADVAKGSGFVANAIGGADRATFESKCEEIGRGGKPTILTEKAKEFFGREDTVKACQKVVDIETKVGVINRELAESEKVSCE